MKTKQSYTFDLEAAKVAFLEEMARRHGLPDAGKGLRGLIEHSR